MSQTGAVLVTGAGRGIGRAIALRLAADGWAVAALSRTPAELASVVAEIEARGGRAVAVVADVTDEVAVEAAWTAAEQALGPITALVNDAGNAPVGPTASFALADWQHCLSVNLTGAFLC
jgi:NAD(P)-dependent dehydrogenase (short-subunit alcohol dehydrogenase family)